MNVPEVRYATRDGRALAYQEWGAGGVDALIISDWPSNSDSVWEHPAHVRVWRFHSAIARCIRFDRSGIGSSDAPAGEMPDVEAWAEDAIAVLDAAGSECAVVAGEGWGSQAAIALAANHPERVSRVVLLNGFARLGRDESYPDGIPQEGLERAAELVRSHWGTGMVVGGAAPSLGREYLDFCARYERIAAAPGVATAMTRVMVSSDVRHLLPRVKCPTLVVYTGDNANIREAHSRYLLAHITGAEDLEVSTDLYYNLGAEAGRRYAKFVSGATDHASTDRELAVIVFTDIVDSTAQLALHGDREWTSILEACNDSVDREVGRFGGRVIKQTGDGHLLTFASPGAAIAATVGIRRAAHAAGVSLRFGMHMGEIEIRVGGDIAGIAVHTAARIAATANADEILVSRVVSDLVAGTGVELADHGEHQFKGLPEPVRIFAVRE